MTERMARCSCGKERPSSERDRLAFFEDRSQTAHRHCRHCGKYEVAHQPGCSQAQPDSYERHAFEPREDAFEFDLYYCGCRGWD